MADFQPENPVPAPIDDDPKTDALVDEIQKTNSDAELEAAFVSTAPVAKRSLKQKYLDNKKWTIPLTIVLLLLVSVFAVPTTRYATLGLVLKKTYTITVNDATTGTPVSKATVTLAGKEVQTDAQGRAIFKKQTVGPQQASVSKQYYKSMRMKVFVGLRARSNYQKLALLATGRQVTVTITNKITGNPVVGVEMSALGTSAKTDKSGSAVLVLPADHKTVTASLVASGYNNTTATIQVTTDPTANSFTLVPSGRVYFLSNASGKVDVISTNYDGSDRQTLLAGTGYEDTTFTQLLASPDQKELALITRRSSGAGVTGLYNIDTASGKMTPIEADARQSISTVGWNNDTFVYTVQKYDVQNWQPGREMLKSYANGQALILDQTDGSGTSFDDEMYQQFSQPMAVIDGTVVYAKSWSAGPSSVSQLGSKTNSINCVEPDGSSKKDLKDLMVPAGTTYSYVGQTTASPHLEYFASPTTSSNDYSQGALFFKFTKGALTQLNNFTANDYSNPNLNGYIATSPSGSSLLYSDVVDGQTVASVSDQSGSKQKLLALHGVGKVQGWLTDTYILVSQDNSQLYVISANPADAKAVPLSGASFYTSPQYP